MSEPIPIASYDQLPPAQALVHALAELGFEAALLNETADQALRFFNAHAHAQFRVTVPPDQMERALAAFASMPRLPAERAHECPVTQAIRCPDCGATRIEFPQFSRNTIVGALPALATTVGLIDAQYFCQSCHFTWAPPKTEPVPISDALS
jgi:hypothetical protein